MSASGVSGAFLNLLKFELSLEDRMRLRRVSKTWNAVLANFVLPVHLPKAALLDRSVRFDATLTNGTQRSYKFVLSKRMRQEIERRDVPLVSFLRNVRGVGLFEFEVTPRNVAILTAALQRAHAPHLDVTNAYIGFKCNKLTDETGFHACVQLISNLNVESVQTMQIYHCSNTCPEMNTRISRDDQETLLHALSSMNNLQELTLPSNYLLNENYLLEKPMESLRRLVLTVHFDAAGDSVVDACLPLALRQMCGESLKRVYIFLPRTCAVSMSFDAADSFLWSLESRFRALFPNRFGALPAEVNVIAAQCGYILRKSFTVNVDSRHEEVTLRLSCFH